MAQGRLQDRLQEAMDKRGLRPVDVVERTGIPKGTISYYLSGKTKPRTDKLLILSKLLDVSEAWLLGYDVPMQRTEDQKKNDQLARLIVRMRNDEAFYNMVVKLDGLNEKQSLGVEQLLAAFNE